VRVKGAVKGTKATAVPGTKPNPNLGCNSKKKGEQDGNGGKSGGKGTDKIKRQPWYSPHWPKCPCNSCGDLVLWREMTQEWTPHGPRHEHFGDMKEEEECWNCTPLCCRRIATQKGMSMPAAKVHIAQSQPNFQRRRTDNDLVNEADQRIAEAFEGLMKGERRLLALEDMRSTLKPLTKFLRLKCSIFRERSQRIAEQDVLMERLRRCADMDEAMGLIPQLEAVELKLDELDRPLAFAGKDNQHQWIAAADYSDEWCKEIHVATGRLISAMRVFHVCLSRGGGGLGTPGLSQPIVPNPALEVNHC